jgi:non-heme chloroperoxidase
MSIVPTEDDAQIFYKAGGPKTAQRVEFHPGWPLSSNDWDAQMLFFLGKG